MGKRGIIWREKAMPAGTYQSFPVIQLYAGKNILIHRIAVWLPDDNENVGVFVKRQSSDGEDDVVEEGVSLVSNISFNEPILLNAFYPSFQVWIRNVLTAGTFRLNVDYEEVS